MSTSSSELRRALRRLGPKRLRTPLARRPDADLAFVGPELPPRTKLLLDTTVYIDQLQARLSPTLSDALKRAEAWHAAVVIAELAHAIARLDPERPERRRIVDAVVATIDDIPGHRILTPDLALWRDAGLLDGLLARLQGRPREDRRRTLNDALLLVLARRHGIAVLTRNLADFDPLQRIVPDAKVLFYRL